ncbi:MAG TPA: dihydrofolate reductase family protein [Chloroflexia bacterium]|nr:dihydrofolate reductase family protein [Chloroflexia bacterium]
MRKVVSGLFISLDGVTEAPNEWQFDSFDQDLGTEMGAMIAGTDTILLGRVTYQEWADYWPTSTDEPFASFINNTPKYVVSTTLETVAWQNATLLKGPLAAELSRLKAQPGKNITVTGSPTLVQSLLQQDLLDELTLMVHPVVVGKGKRLFLPGGNLKRLQLVTHKTTSTGVAILTYHPK